MIRTSLRWDGDITLMTARLDDQPDLTRFLTPEELARADRFRLRPHRRRYVAARGVLRFLIAERVDVAPRDLNLVAGEQGKPLLASHPDLSFNVSHSHDLALFAFSAEGDVGVDVEHLRDLDPLVVSSTCFSASERLELALLPHGRRLDAFFEGWVRKEAVIKADGRGMSLPLDSFSVRLVGPPRLTEPPSPLDADWDLHSVPVGHAARAAVAHKRSHPSGVFDQPGVRVREARVSSTSAGETGG